jgi:3'-5' exoribonuclease
VPQPTDLSSLAIGARVQETLLVLDVEHRATADGSPFIVLTLGNSSGRIETEPFWLDRQDAVAGIHAGHVAQVIGEVDAYRDRRQLRVTSLRVIPRDSVDSRALLPSVGAVDRYWQTLDGWRREIVRPRLRRVVDLFYEDPDFRAAYEQSPASIRGHHAALGGLLKHTTEVAAIGRTIARTAGADGELVLAGALLHDIGKLEAYRWDGVFEYTEAGRLVGHVQHLILSHHGRLELGSPVRPMTLEAEVLHWADNTSAKTSSLADALADPANFPQGPVSTHQPTLDGRRVMKLESDWGV